jgi:hypothetical protein
VIKRQTHGVLPLTFNYSATANQRTIVHNKRFTSQIFTTAARGCSNFNNLKSRGGVGGDHFRILQWSVLLWIGNLGEQF